MTDEKAARAALEAHGFEQNNDAQHFWERPNRFGYIGYNPDYVTTDNDGHAVIVAAVGYDRLPALLAALDDKPLDITKQVLDLCDQAIGLFLEYRDQHGEDEDDARTSALAEVLEGLNAEPAIAEMEAAKRVCPRCEGDGVCGCHDSQGRVPKCPDCHGTGTADPPTDAPLLRTAALWMMHLSLDRLPPEGEAATKTAQMSDALLRLAARLEQDPPPPDTQPEPVLSKE